MTAAALKFSQDSAEANAKIRLLRDKVAIELGVAVAIPALIYALGLLAAWVARGFREKA